MAFEMVYVWIVLAAAALVFLLLTAFAWLILQSVFGKRCGGNPNLTYYTAADFEGLSARPVEFPSNKGQLLRGNLYFHAESAPYRALLVFVHGMGGGHLSYTTEINTLAQKGFLVLSYDQTGTCSSEGKSLVGFTQGALDLRAALDFVKSNPELNRYPVLLAGHSWGGYTVCQALQFSPDVKAVAALSAFEDESALVCGLTKGQIGLSLGFLKPFYKLANRLKFGRAANRKTSDILKEAKVPVLLLHGEEDRIVSLENSAAIRFSGWNATPLVKGILYPGKFHNVYQSLESEQYLGETFAKITAVEKRFKGKLPPEEKEALYGAIDFRKMTEEDPEVMDFLSDFLAAGLGE